MSSGYFPLDKRDVGYEELKEISKVVDKIRNEYVDHVKQLCAEDAVYDGGYLELLDQASRFISMCIKK